MVENSKIEWTDHTFNPWIGCAKVSPGCEHCYAETLMDTRYGRVEWGVNGTRVLTGDANWRKPVKWNRDAECLRTFDCANNDHSDCCPQKIRPRVFCSSLADVFEDREELLPWLLRLTMLIEECPNLDWLLLTKRPEKVQERLERIGCPPNWLWEHPQVWLGVSAEDQLRWDQRVEALRQLNPRVRFVSVEPMIGPINAYGQFFVTENCEYLGSPRNMIDWVIVGGESGQGARPMDPDWARSLRDQCQAAGVPFFFKQWGENVVPDQMPDETYGEVDAAVNLSALTEQYYRVGKKKAGRLLDGREWSQFPESRI